MWSRLILILLLPFIACMNVNSQRQSKEQDESYVNFDQYRPVFPDFSIDSLISRDTTASDTIYVVDQGHFMTNSYLGDSLRVLMDTLALLNNSVPYYGYRIVLYTGSDRQKAIFERGRALKLLENSDTRVYMNYQRPYFKVKVGNFYDRTTAFPTYKKLKAAIPTALLVPDIIELDKVQYK
jgi:hypothetical protein